MAIVLIDADDRILNVNPEFTRIFGYAEEEACGRLLKDLIVPEELLVEEEDFTSRARRGERAHCPPVPSGSESVA